MAEYVVTGAFGYIGRAIAGALLNRGDRVRTITTHPDKPNPFGDAVAAYPYDFEQPDRLARHLAGTDVLFNTYWIRFPHAGMTFESAVENTQRLFQIAKAAGVRKIVHISVTRASPESSLAYYRGKAAQEKLLRQLDMDFAILRPTLVFGPGDILVNNIAWLLRRFPLFPLFGGGDYRLQPVHVDDVARLAVELAQGGSSQSLDAAGPDTFTFRSLVRLMADHLGVRVALIRAAPSLGLFAGRLIGRAVGDVLLTAEELAGLMQEYLVSDDPPTGTIRFAYWLDAYADRLGLSYHSEIGRHFEWSPSEPGPRALS